MSSKHIIFAPYVCSSISFSPGSSHWWWQEAVNSWLTSCPLSSWNRVSLTVPNDVPKELSIMVGSFAQPEINDYNQRNSLLWLSLPGSHASSYSLKESSSQTICTEGGGGGTSQKIFLLMPKDKKIDTGQARATNIDYRNVLLSTLMGFPDSSVGKESACNAGDPGLTPGSGRSAGEGISYPLQYSWASLLGQLVKNPPAKKKKKKRIHLQCGRPGFNPCVGKIPWRRKNLPTPVFWPGEFYGLYSLWVHNKSDMTEWLSLSLSTWIPSSLSIYSFKPDSGCSLSRVLINTIFCIPLHYRLVPWAS